VALLNRFTIETNDEVFEGMPQAAVHPLWGSLALQRQSNVSLQDQLVEFFRAAISDGRMQGGQRVPSTRQLAVECDVSRTTAVEVYQRLVAEGYFVTRPGAGVFVADPTPQHFGLPASGLAVPLARRPDATRVDMRTYLLPLAPGTPAIDQFPWSTWARLINQVCHERPLNAVGYGDPQGEQVLRQTIAEYLATARGILCDADQIVLLAGTELTLDYVLGQVAAAGDKLLLENPCYPHMRRVPRKLAIVPVPIPVDRDGLDVDEALRRAPDARVAIVSPTHQYPTGATLSLTRRQALADWSDATGAWIVENEIDGDYRYAPQPLAPVFALSRSQRVFYCGSLSKPLAPGLRANYVVVPRSLTGNVSLSATLVPMLTQLVLARFNANGHLAAHMRRMRTLYARRRSVLLEELSAQASDYLTIPQVPEGGLRVASTMKHDIDDIAFARRCLAAGIKVDPLSICYDGGGVSGLIIGFASTPEARIPTAVSTLVREIRRELDS
jgi:GntR family transcriptional regulator/MocR family aminotransferase